MKLNKFFKWLMVALILISAALVVWGFSVGFEANGGQATDVLLYWAYIMVGIALVSWIVVGGVIAVKNDPKSLIKMGLVLVGIVVVCVIAYVLAPANPAYGREGLDSHGILKLTDTILNLTYIFAALAILAIIVGEVRLAITNKR